MTLSLMVDKDPARENEVIDRVLDSLNGAEVQVTRS
jgi:hypothetical protein